MTSLAKVLRKVLGIAELQTVKYEIIPVMKDLDTVVMDMQSFGESEAVQQQLKNIKEMDTYNEGGSNV